jgi:hypothetical protein
MITNREESNMELGSCGSVQTIFRVLPRGAEKNHNKHEIRISIALVIFEPDISRIHIQSVTPTPVRSGE